MSRGELNVHHSICDLGRATESEEDIGHNKKRRKHASDKQRSCPTCMLKRSTRRAEPSAPERVLSSTSQTMGYLLIPVSTQSRASSDSSCGGKAIQQAGASGAGCRARLTASRLDTDQANKGTYVLMTLGQVSCGT